MKTKLAIFDMDGTLFNTEKVNFLSYKHALIDYGYELDYDFYVQECNGRFYKDYLPLIVPNPSPQLLEDIHNKKKKFYSSNLASAKVNTHLFNIINGIKQEYFIALVTTASRTNCYDLLNYFQKTHLFDLILTHNDVKEVKPDPEGFIRAMYHFGIKADKTIIFEDSDVGIIAAKKTGATVLTVANIN